MISSGLCSPKLQLIEQKNIKNSNIGKYDYNLKELIPISVHFKM